MADMSEYQYGQKIVIPSCPQIVEAEIIEIGNLPNHHWLTTEHREGDNIIHNSFPTNRQSWRDWLSLIEGRETELVGQKVKKIRTGNPDRPYAWIIG
jgi:hypothetical protein